MNLRLVIRTALVAVVAVLHSFAWSAPLPANAYEEAMSRVGRYCINNVCLGMMLDQVSSAGRLEVDSASLPLKGTIECTAYPFLAAASLVTSDGSKYSLAFDVVDSVSSPARRYRLASITKFVPGVTQLQLDYLTQSLLKRFGRMQQIEDTSSWFRKDEATTITVMAGGIGTVNPGPFIEASARFNLRKEWLMSLPSCLANLPAV